MLWILIASTGSQEYLEETLNNLNWIPPKTRVIISLHSFSNNTSFSKGEIILRSKALQQFDHYDLLSKELSIDDEDRVILLDDDDILLSNILKEKGSFVGYQILMDNQDVTQLSEYFTRNPDIDKNRINPQRLVTDLSGTTTSGYYFKQYFNHRPQLDYARDLEDTSYMNYIESLPDCHPCSQPFVIHRLKENPSLWQQQLQHAFR